MMNVPYVVLKYATLLLSFPINNVVEVVLTTLSAILKSTNNPSHLQGIHYKYYFLSLYGNLNLILSLMIYNFHSIQYQHKLIGKISKIILK